MNTIVNKRVAITGADSMVGRAVIKELEFRGANTYRIRHNVYDLMNIRDALWALKNHDYCIHCAGYNGNIAFNKDYPADIFYRTAQIGLNVLTACQQQGIQKVVSLLSSCSYPNVNLLKETEFLNGEPNEGVEAHGYAKRLLFNYSKQLYKQHKLNAVCVIFNTCYGPYDSFDVNKTKVVGGLINKIYDARINNKPEVECWGTGSARREFIYIDDAARLIVDALERYDDPTLPLNLGAGTDNTIKELAELIQEIVGYKGDLRWDTSKPDGQYQKLLDVTRMNELFSSRPQISLKEGLTKTINWYITNVIK